MALSDTSTSGAAAVLVRWTGRAKEEGGGWGGGKETERGRN